MAEERDPVLDPMKQVVASWGWLLVYGIILAGLGLFAMFEPKTTTGIVAGIFAVGMIIAGVFDIVGAMAGEEQGGPRWPGVIAGIVSLILGIIVLRNIHASIAFIGLILGIFWLVRGLVMIAAGVMERGMPGRGWRIVGGLIFTVLGAYVLGSPTAGPSVIIWLTGALFLLAGILEVIVAFHVKGLQAKTS